MSFSLKGVVLHLSKFSGEVTSGFLSKVIKTVLEGKEVSSMEDGENLKVKAILEYEDGITLNNRLVFFINSKNLFYLFFFL